MTSRVIRKDSVYCNSQIRDLLQSLFAAEFICPSSHLWLVSAWVSDIPVLDNTGMGFAAISPRWGPRKIRLSEVLVELAAQGSTESSCPSGPSSYPVGVFIQAFAQTTKTADAVPDTKTMKPAYQWIRSDSLSQPYR